MKKKISKIYFNFFSWDFIIYTQHTSKFGIMLKSTPLLICSLKYYFKILFVQSKFEYVQKKIEFMAFTHLDVRSSIYPLN